MNANELADIVDKWAYKESAEYLTDAANMLRQQADRIRNLEKTLGFKNSGYETINLTPPVAWINLDRFNDEALYLADCVSETKVDNMGITTPLYTHPAETITLAELRKTELYRTEQTRSLREFLEPKELTDKEITAIWYEPTLRYDPVAFARAILRKAQEK